MIERLQPGDGDRTLLHADVGNEIIDQINALIQMEFSPPGAAYLQVSESNVRLCLKTFTTTEVVENGALSTYNIGVRASAGFA